MKLRPIYRLYPEDRAMHARRFLDQEVTVVQVVRNCDDRTHRGRLISVGLVAGSGTSFVITLRGGLRPRADIVLPLSQVRSITAQKGTHQ